MSLCAGALVLAGSLFTLSWTHTVEKVGWEEDWQVTPAGLVLVEARLRGSGAGMEPPPAAVLREGWWRWRPDLPPQPVLRLARAAGAGAWRLCPATGACHSIGPAPDPLLLHPCED